MTTITDIRQSARYAQFMQSLGWQVEEIDGIKIFIKPFPLIGATIKIQRADKLPDINKLHKLMKKYHCRSISFEPDLSFQRQMTNDQRLKNPYLPTKTILIDLTTSETTIFNRFSEAKRRAVRRAEKAGVVVKGSDDINEFISLKNKTAGLLGFLTTTTLQPLWKTFAPDQTTVLLAYFPVIPSPANSNIQNEGGIEESLTSQLGVRKIPPRAPLGRDDKIVAGILLLFHNKTAYYWIAAATEAGKKSFAPTLLVWEALKLAKQKGCTIFDFEGIYDERYPNLNKNWLGFTKFKSGFGGKSAYFVQPFTVN
ncbi:TPA: hypothetical protein DIV55_06550 [Patescibacteria group bacterium]|uniref:Methicillin resistance protein n=1 Tax=Candidatus Gottesmanbacteria bacterium GW2011_GWA1_43_11 TaxID=1618436 RepID=A0A0G1CK50_9BACT|nr:MAG: Methicillin resistance protein [Candidatus Gottesmanbacteria bacterium GW2011_GWA1_43_11]HCS79364.1 hypothetical protein [Patescibacteria group bacterium]